MHHKYNKFLIASFLIVCVLGLYSLFLNNLKSEAAVDEEGGLSSSLDTSKTTSKISVSSGKASEDTAFLMKLASLNRIKIDTSLFSDESFKILIDNNIKLEPVPFGRSNPFAPVSGMTISTPVNDVTPVVNAPALPNNLVNPVKSIKTTN